ncbi:MAG: bifunctional proline dehydrogenase/L-glutamate gamma-semialdehyde dehydrogenase, partial [Actinomycetia bacterium]|nr:bifunctional proline dehydrogenase/L-glutamate gamma-semialdehyde dehydrogenase [Actinomycetes bacterium]
MAASSTRVHSKSADELVDPAIQLVETWLARAAELETRSDRATMKRLGQLVSDEAGVGFVMQFVDRVARPDDNRVAAHQLAALVNGSPLPSFLSPIDALLLRAGAWLAPHLPSIVMPLAKRRMRSIVGHLVAPADPRSLGRHLGAQRHAGYDVNVNLLGEAVLGEREADARLHRLTALLQVPDVDYVSVKLTAVASQLNHWAYDASLRRVTDRLALLVDAANSVSPPTFVNFDMEEYHDLRLTVEAFKTVLGDPSRTHIDSGIVLQAYLPDVFPILQDLVVWAKERHQRGGGTIKIRLVKGANLAMERVDAAMHGWEQAPFGTKIESDANYRRCLDWVLTPEHLTGVRIGLASHNLFDVALTRLLATERGVLSQVQFEMLQGMASGQAKAVNESTATESASSMLLYTPAVSDDDFDVAIGYLFRRLEENAAPENFMRALFDLEPGSPELAAEAEFFRRGVALRHTVSAEPSRRQDRSQPIQPWPLDATFRNEPDTDPSLEANRHWIDEVASATPSPCHTPITDFAPALAQHLAIGRRAASRWAQGDRAERRVVLHRVGDELARRRGELITTMMHEASKTFAEADVEVSEAIDFARWYAERSVDLGQVRGATFDPFGLIAVIPPWNFPTAIPAGGVLASLAAGNTVIFKPAPETPRCAEVVAEACWAAGVPTDVLQFVRTPDNEIGRQLVESVDAVILTGSTETADLFRSWKPGLRLFAETSGKNALIITPNADLDQAAQDLVRSAFGHGGQKCSAASLAILVGDVYESERFRRQLTDAVESLTIGSPLDLETDMAPLVGGINDRLRRAAEILDPGESWLVEPSIRDDGVMTPGVKAGVEPGSWFHRTECFGPVLGLMAAADLDEAIAIANASDF